MTCESKHFRLLSAGDSGLKTQTEGLLQQQAASSKQQQQQQQQLQPVLLSVAV